MVDAGHHAQRARIAFPDPLVAQSRRLAATPDKLAPAIGSATIRDSSTRSILALHPFRAVLAAVVLVAVQPLGCSSDLPFSTPAGPKNGVSVGRGGYVPATPMVAECVGGPDAARTPIEYGSCVLEGALAPLATRHQVRISTAEDGDAWATLAQAGVVVDERPESFAIVQNGDESLIVGRDAIGALYGALELAERVQLDRDGAFPISPPITAAPAVEIRAANPFIVLPAPGETSWWFLDPDYWREYLDLMASARMNFLDIHAMYNLENTIFPNALLYFARSSTYPTVGVDDAERERNLAMLNEIIAMAAARGIRVGLMSYRADTSPLGDTPTSLDDAALAQYTREAAADLAVRAKGLWRIGFRIGESSRPAAWYTSTFVAGVNDTATGVGLYTRTWLTTKSDILAVVGASRGDTIVEAKYNGEHFASPYAIAGGEFAHWSSYSYEDYLDPPSPYSFVFQVRSGGTHRVFRNASFERSKRAALSFLFSPRTKGFTLEPPHAYFPQRDFYHANPDDRFSPWTFRRDELLYLLMGRLSYDPSTPERVFRAALEKRVGTDALWDAVQAASDIVPWIQTAHTCGPDARDFAPDLELGGDIAYWASERTATPPLHSCSLANHGPFDSFAIASPSETAKDLILARPTSRVSAPEVANIVLESAARARAASTALIDRANVEAVDVVRECTALADLGEYFGHKLRGATALAVYEATGASGWLASARQESAAATAAWTNLAADTSYIAPFEDNLRASTLGLKPFHWRDEVSRLDDDRVSIENVVAAVTASPPTFLGALPTPDAWFASPKDPGPELASLQVYPPDAAASSWTVTVSFTDSVPAGASVNVLSKPFESATDWSVVRATADGTRFTAVVPGTGRGAMFAVEVLGNARQGWRYPDVLRETPYRVLTP
jgi:hypothetical protein